MPMAPASCRVPQAQGLSARPMSKAWLPSVSLLLPAALLEAALPLQPPDLEVCYILPDIRCVPAKHHFPDKLQVPVQIILCSSAG